MSLRFHQSKITLKILEEKNQAIILGEILHYVWEWILSKERSVLKLKPDSEEFKQKVDSYLQKALAYYPEPLPMRKKIKEKATKILYKAFKSSEIEKLRKLFLKKDLKVYPEAESFFMEKGEILEIRPDLILKSKDHVIIFEFKLHGESKREEEQLKNYQKFLKKLSSNVNIGVYLLVFDPFYIEQRYVSSPSYSSQLKLFENP